MSEFTLYEIPELPARTTVTQLNGQIWDLPVLNLDSKAIAEHHDYGPALENMAAMIALNINRALAMNARPEDVYSVLTLVGAHFETQFSGYLEPRIQWRFK